ncbi:hypothetical protein [Ornithinimicrobium sp. INDO-MA30-4]|uniref:hypothetical protein n=1 Tax=Ornithinimicrobium sp. INDO-MA30-4 TaxID=2908651 RepID=UPI001F267E9C|nr:hypothetical protein [Ornithinimicrobium sp. INDO-MA30-4]UJH70171.1 hypothetical protein L0A91_13430 [Ornithinimicrobium sp. INDO-MA30-4]
MGGDTTRPEPSRAIADRDLARGGEWGTAKVSAGDQWQNRFAALTGEGHPAPSLLVGIGFTETHVVDAYAAALVSAPPQ